jgi:hypothetical protein
MKPVNIVLLMADQQRWDALGHTGGWVRTPNLDRLAAEEADAPASSTDLRDGVALLHAYGLDDIDEIAGPRGSMHIASNMTEQWQQKEVWQA